MVVSEDFESARNKAILKVMEGDRKRYLDLERRFKILQSEYNTLLIVHMNVIDDCIKKKHKLREHTKKIKEDFNKLLHEEQNKGWNDL